MQLTHYADSQLSELLRRSKQWQMLDTLVKQNVPPALHDYFKVICIQNSQLIIHASHPMVAARLKLLQPALLGLLDEQLAVDSIIIKQKPHTEAPRKSKDFKIPQRALVAFDKTAQKLQHHPELASALQRLIEHHQT